MLAAAASRTRSAFLGTFVDNVMNREPALVARMASTLQAVSGGRFRLGITIGGNAREHEASGIPLPPATVRADHLRRPSPSSGRCGPEVRVVRGCALPARGGVRLPRPEPEPPILAGAQRRPGPHRGVAGGWLGGGESLVRGARGRPIGRRWRARVASARRSSWSSAWVVDGRGGRRWTGRGSTDPHGTLAAWQARGADEVTVTVRTESEVSALVEAAARW